MLASVNQITKKKSPLTSLLSPSTGRPSSLTGLDLGIEDVVAAGAQEPRRDWIC